MKSAVKKTGSFTTLLILVSFFASSQTQPEGVSIKTTAGAPHASAMLDVESTTKGLLIPRVALTNTSSSAPVATTPATALLVWNTATNSSVTPGFYFWEGGWKKLASNVTELWKIDPNTPGGNPGIMRNGGTVTVGNYTAASASTTLNILGPTVFWAQGGANTAAISLPGSGTGYGLHIGDPVNHQNVPGGHANEINFYGEPLDLQWYSKQDVRVGAFGGSNLNVYKAGDPTKGNIMAEKDIVAYGIFYSVQGNWSASDSTLKKNFSEVSNVLPSLSNLKTYTYQYKTEGPDDKYHIGIIAQELEGYYPQLVTGRTFATTDFTHLSDGKQDATPVEMTKKTVDYQGLTALLLQAIKEQQAQIDNLKARLDAAGL